MELGPFDNFQDPTTLVAISVASDHYKHIESRQLLNRPF